MVRIKINGIEYKLQTRWEETDPDKLMVCEGIREEIAALSDIPVEILNQATELQLWPIYVACSFIDDTDAMPAIEPTNKKGEPVNVENLAYKRLELAKQFLKFGKPYRKILNVARVYYPKEKNPVRLIGLGVSIVNQISIFLGYYEEMFKSEATGEQESAGIQSLSDFGSWGTVFAMANKNILDVNKIMNKPAIEVYTALHYSWRESKYLEALHEIRSRKK